MLDTTEYEAQKVLDSINEKYEETAALKGIGYAVLALVHAVNKLTAEMANQGKKVPLE
jgi:hypothetical protein